MKKFMIISLLFAFVFAGNINANQAVTSKVKEGSEVSMAKKDHNFLKTIKAKVNTKVNKIKRTVLNNINDLQTSLGGNLRTALILMVVGLIFLILAGAIGGSIVWAVGAIFFLIGAILLLLELI